MKTRFLAVILSCWWVFCWSGAAFAGATEDYEAGRKAFDDGDVSNALVLLKKAADQKHVPAQILLGHVLDGAGEDELAVEYFRKAANQGEAEAEFELGSMYVKGEGVAQDLMKARTLIRSAAEKGYVGAVVVLAEAYLNGGLGFSEAERKDPVESARWIKSAAEKGHAGSLVFLVDRFLGAGGQDVEAYEWVRKAAEREYLPAVEALAQAYRDGSRFGLAANMGEAEKWEAKAKALKLKSKGKKR